MSTKSMPDRDYERYKSAIQQANKDNDKDALRNIQKQLISNYGLDNERVKRLLALFKYHV